jgi:hypothetical protein
MERNHKVYYLSEMNLSDRHGGGLTLQRILGNDLDNFDNFIQLFEFPGNFPTADRFISREINLWKDLPPFKQRKTPKRFTRDYFVVHFRRFFNLTLPDYRHYDFKTLYFYEKLAGILSLDNSKFLVVPQQIQSIYLMNFLYKKHKMEYAVWMMDDHLLRYNNSKGFHYPHPPAYEGQFRRFLKNARVVFVISPNMKDFYKDRFGIQADVLFGPSDPAMEELKVDNVMGSPSTAITLCYFGALWKWQEDALEKLLQALDKLDVDLHIFSFNVVSEKISKHNRVKIMEPVKAHEVKALMRTYEGVIVPYGFSDDLKPLSALNISTKLSECLASGVPTVLVGPDDGAMTLFGKQYKCAIILSNVEDSEQLLSFKEAFKPERKKALLRNAKWVSENITSTDAMKKIWRDGWQRGTNN